MVLINLSSKRIILEREIEKEKQIHNYIENNLYPLFALKLLKSKFRLNGKELDILAIDLNKCLAIIEFKREYDSEQIAQIIEYYKLLKANKEKIKELLEVNFYDDWVQLICIAKEFSPKIVSLVNELNKNSDDNYTLNLYRYTTYENNLLHLDKVDLADEKSDYYFNEF